MRTMQGSLQQMAAITALQYESQKVEMRKTFGIKEDANPMLELHINLHQYGMKIFVGAHATIRGSDKWF